MREIVGRIDSPGRSGPVVRLLQYSVCRKVPHLRVAVFNILQHSQESFPGLVFTVPHASEFGQIVFYALLCVGTSKPGPSMVHASSLGFKVLVCPKILAHIVNIYFFNSGSIPPHEHT